MFRIEIDVMSVIINFKICDNAKECNGIAVCPPERYPGMITKNPYESTTQSA